MGLPETPGSMLNFQFETSTDNACDEADAHGIDVAAMETVEIGIVPYTPSIGSDYHEYNVGEVVYGDNDL